MELGSGSLDPGSSGGEGQVESTGCQCTGEGERTWICSSSRASVTGVTLPEGPHGMVEAAARKRRCPAPTRALAGARASGCGTNLTRVGHCQAKSCPGQPGASLAKPLTAGKNREQGAGWPPPCCSLKCFPVPAFGRACPAPSTQHAAAGLRDAGST